MRASLSLKSLLRTPVKTLLTFLLLASASFVLFSRISEYTVTMRETRDAISFYQGTGALDTGIPFTGETTDGYPGRYKYSQIKHHPEVDPPALTRTQMEAFISLPQVSGTDIRYMTSGISDTYYRMDVPNDPSYNYTTRFIMEGTYMGYHDAPFTEGAFLRLDFSDCNVLAGSSRFPGAGLAGLSSYVDILAEDMPPPEDGSYPGIVSGGGGGIVERIYYLTSGNPFGKIFADTLTEGGRYLLIGRWEPRMPQARMLGDYDTMDNCPSFWELDGQPEDYLKTGEFTRVQELIEITNHDLRTFDMVYTSDMSAIPRFAEKKMVMAEGRMLTPSDLGSNACVVSRTFLIQNKRTIGDTITMGLGGKLLEQHAGMGAVAVTNERYSPPVKKVELEIVGAYMDTDGILEQMAYMNWCYSVNTIFVPSTLLPVEPPPNHPIKPGEFSFVIGNARDIDGFLETAEPLAEEHGIKLWFHDGGWAQVSRNMDANNVLSMITTFMFICAAVIALLLANYLFIGRAKREFAIMRALGTPCSVAQYTLLLRFGVLSALAIPAGAAVGLVFTSRSVTSVLSGMAAEITAAYVPDTSLPAAAVVFCAVVEVVFLALFCTLSLRTLGKTPPLVLLQAGSAIRRKPTAALQEKKARDRSVKPLNPTLPVSDSPYLPSDSRRYGAVRHVARNIVLRIRRTKWKAALTVLLATLLPGAMGLFSVMQLSYDHLFDNLEIKCFVAEISSGAAYQAVSSELIKDSYYQGSLFVMCDASIPAEMVVTNDIDRYSEGMAAVAFDEGFDASFVYSRIPQCVIGDSLAQMLGVTGGDTISLMNYNLYVGMQDHYKEEDELVRQLARNSVRYTIVGIASSEDEHNDMRIFAAGGYYAGKVNGGDFPLELGEFILADNSQAEALRTYTERLVSQSKQLSEFSSYVMDTTELKSIIRIRNLLEVLFAIAVAAAVLIGMIAPGLILLHSSKEAAILRVLGTTKSRTRLMMAAEPMFLCIAGLVFAAFGLRIYDAALFTQAVGSLAICFGLFLAGVILSVGLASVAVTRRKVLELLQTRE